MGPAHEDQETFHRDGRGLKVPLGHRDANRDASGTQAVRCVPVPAEFRPWTVPQLAQTSDGGTQAGRCVPGASRFASSYFCSADAGFRPKLDARTQECRYS